MITPEQAIPLTEKENKLLEEATDDFDLWLTYNIKEYNVPYRYPYNALQSKWFNLNTKLRNRFLKNCKEAGWEIEFEPGIEWMTTICTVTAIKK